MTEDDVDIVRPHSLCANFDGIIRCEACGWTPDDSLPDRQWHQALREHVWDNNGGPGWRYRLWLKILRALGLGDQ